jgi:hypothetical protein
MAPHKTTVTRYHVTYTQKIYLQIHKRKTIKCS